MPELLSEEAIEHGVSEGAWQREGNAIVLELRLGDFAAAVRYVDRVAELAEAAAHHPDILIHEYNWVRLTLTTHAAGGLTSADLALAKQIDALR